MSKRSSRKASKPRDESAAHASTVTEDVPSQSDEAATGAPQKTIASALGEIAWLLAQSSGHRHSLFVGDLEWLVMPPLTKGQYRLFYAKGRPVGVALWAFVSETVEQRLAGGGRLGANEWRSGDRVWVVELIAPFGQQEIMLEDLRRTALADRRFRFVRTHPNGRRETVTLDGDPAAGDERRSERGEAEQ